MKKRQNVLMGIVEKRKYSKIKIAKYKKVMSDQEKQAAENKPLHDPYADLMELFKETTNNNGFGNPDVADQTYRSYFAGVNGIVN